jgi:hypothetical protein
MNKTLLNRLAKLEAARPVETKPVDERALMARIHLMLAGGLAGLARRFGCRDEADLVLTAWNDRADFCRRYAAVSPPCYSAHQVHPSKAKGLPRLLRRDVGQGSRRRLRRRYFWQRHGNSGVDLEAMLSSPKRWPTSSSTPCSRSGAGRTPSRSTLTTRCCRPLVATCWRWRQGGEPAAARGTSPPRWRQGGRGAPRPPPPRRPTAAPYSLGRGGINEAAA